MFKRKVLNRLGISIASVLILFGVGYLIEDIVMTNALGYYHCSQEPNPKTFIKKTVEYPESIYWQDNIYNGFGVTGSGALDDRELMIINYLDGKRLKKIALNGLDGKIYVFTAMNTELLTKAENLMKSIETRVDSLKHIDDESTKKRIISENKKMRKESKKILKNYAQQIISKAHVYESEEAMPYKMNYKVVFNPVKLDDFSSKYLYSDEVEIFDNRTNEMIAYNRRYMHFFYKLAPDFVGGRYYVGQVCGDRKFLRFDEKVFGIFSSMGPPKHYDLMDYFLTGKYQNKGSDK